MAKIREETARGVGMGITSGIVSGIFSAVLLAFLWGLVGFEEASREELYALGGVLAISVVALYFMFRMLWKSIKEDTDEELVSPPAASTQPEPMQSNED